MLLYTVKCVSGEVLGPSSPSSRQRAAAVLVIQALAVARFKARCVGIWKGQMNER